MQVIADYSKKHYKQLIDYQKGVKEAWEELEEDSRCMSAGEQERYVRRKMAYMTPATQSIEARLRRFQPAYCTLSAWIDALTDEFDLFLIKECPHLTAEYDSFDSTENKHNPLSGDFAEVMRQIQSFSAIIFFILVHIPLSRLNSTFCFLTCLLPLLLNLKTKYWFYEKTNRFVLFFFRNDPEAKNYVRKPKELRNDHDVNIEDEPNDLYLSKEEQSDQESAAYALVVYLSLFFSLLFNYLYSLWLQEIVTTSCDVITRAFDKLEIEVHSIRYL